MPKPGQRHAKFLHAEYSYAEHHCACIILLSVVVLIVIMLSIVVLIVIMLSVVVLNGILLSSINVPIILIFVMLEIANELIRFMPSC